MSSSIAQPDKTAASTPEPVEVRRGIGFALDFDVYLALATFALVSFGLMMVFSTTFDWSYQTTGSPVMIFLKQVRSLGIGLAVAAILSRLDYRIWRRVAVPVMVLTIAALIVLLTLVREESFGAQRALYQGSYQPGEAAKLAVILYLAAWLASHHEHIRRITYGLLPFSLLVGAVGGLVVLQPDLSTAAIIVLVAWTMFYLAGADVLQLAASAGLAGVAGWLVTTQFGYARDRLAEHWKSVADLTQASWHVQQAVIAFTAPGRDPLNPFSPNWFGVGLGQSRQKFGFLPAPHTDSIFAIIGEELGLFGCLVVIALFGLFVWRGFKIAREAQDPFGSILAAGISCWIAYEGIMNVAVMTAVIPFTGVPLPFISFGGSNLVTVLAGVGLLLSISRRRPRDAPRRIRADYYLGGRDSRRRVSRVSGRGSVGDSSRY
jgi:cell division protein FtsW